MRRIELSRFLPLVFHVTALVHHILVFKYSHEVDFSKTTDPRVLIMKQYSFRYFTCWNLVIQTLYFGLSMCYDILKLSSSVPELKHKLSMLKGYIFTSLMFPCTLFVSAMFWSIYNINREWVLPKAADAIFPAWLNHSLHTCIIIFLLIDLLISNHKLPSFRKALIGFTMATLVYNFVFVLTYFESGNWLYGIFQVLEWHERIIFMVINYAASVLAMHLGIMIQEYKPTGISTLKKVKLI